MKSVCEASDLSEISLIGGKGSHLQKLVKWGAPVSPFFVVTTEAFDFYQENKKLPDDVERRFLKFFQKNKKIALRSSMISEDNVDSSFAGLFETILDVSEENWKNSLLQIFNSVHSDRVQEYIRRKNLTVDLKMAVVAQELIQVDKSGVLFTRSPVNPTSAIAIDAAFGMGEGVVSGHVDVDHYLLTRSGDLVLHRSVNAQKVLSELELQELIKLSLSLENQMKQPADIEWGYEQNKLYIFQIRPITRSFENLTYFVDTNLSESYPGTVSPFTAEFVKKAYENVFYESASLMGAGKKRLSQLHYHYSRLISCVDDHLYYNLEHYYAALRSLPGGEKNIEKWHKMIGGKISGLSIPYYPTELNKVETIQTLCSLLKLSLQKKKEFEPFLRNLEEVKQEIESELHTKKDSSALIIYLNELINRPLGFGLTVANDIFIMMGLGLLTRILAKNGFKEDQVIDLLKTSEGIDSVKPLESFNALVSDLSDEFIQVFCEQKLEVGFDPYSKIFSSLEEKGYIEETGKLRQFLSDYGDRSFEELKLESLPMKNNPLLVKQLLLWAKQNNLSSKVVHKSAQDFKLNWLGKKILNSTRESIALREASRLWRGKFYHLLRQLVLSLGQQLKSEDSSWEDFSVLDFFSVTHSEWMKFADGSLTKAEIQDLIQFRQNWQTKKQIYPEIIPWVASEKLPELNTISGTGALEGQGVSPGIAEGVALVLDKPDEALTSDLKDFILVTKNTDPAWVYIMSRSLGLISEKGSLLSHTAIIGRELNIPTIVGVKMATQKIKHGSRIRIDASKGTIEVL